jgi:ankyrin repeat protein
MASLTGLMEAVANPAESITEQRAKIWRWLSPIFTEDARRDAKNLLHESTCGWIFGVPVFSRWSTCEGNKSKLLWLHGPAGFGKTVLCGKIIDHMERESSSYGQILIFFCSGEDYNRRHPFAILKSWIGQLLVKDVTAVEAAIKEDELQQKIGQGTDVSEADQDYLWSLFRRILMKLPHCSLIIDGYDECVEAPTTTSKYHTQSCRTYFLQELLKAINGTGTHVLLVSRNQRDIEETLKEPSIDPKLMEVIEHAITKDNTIEDVSAFSNALFAKKLTMKIEKRIDVADKAVEKSEGMFLWIALLDKRLRAGATKREVEKLLSETPSEIDAAYQRELDRILNPNADEHLTARAIVILKLILFSARPLTVREMAEALAVSFNDSTTEYPQDDLPYPFTEESIDENYVDNYIRMPCGSLIELRQERRNVPLASQTIHFVHFSVKEFLLRTNFRINSLNRRLLFREESTEHDWMAGLCLQYMCYDEFDDASDNGVKSPDIFFSSYPFFSYATLNWYEHFCRGQSSNTRAESSNLIWELFNTAHWKLWAQLYEASTQDTSRDLGDLEYSASLDDNLVRKFDNGGDESDEELVATSNISPSPVYYAAILGLSDVVERLIKEGNDCTLAGGKLGNPLQAAVVNKQGATIDMLLKYNANASQQGGEYGTPLIAAVILGSADRFAQLMSSNPELDVTDKDGMTALHHACSLGTIDMVKKLVDGGASLPLKSKSGRASLMLAIKHKNLEVVEYLLQMGADVNEEAPEELTPLFLAISIQSLNIVKQLLHHNADLHHKKSRGATALHGACYVGSATITQLLLEHGAAVDAMAVYGWTPLHGAVLSNSRECAELLLGFGASPLASHDYETPYAVAVRRRATSIVEMFDKYERLTYSSPASLSVRIAAALRGRDADLVASLLQGCDRSSIKTDVIQEILAFALKGEHQTLFHQLKVDVLKLNEPDKSATEVPEDPVWSHAEEMILRKLSWANDVQKTMVLDPAWRFFPGARDFVPNAMLPVAVSNRSQRVVKLLLAHGADAYRRVGLDGFSIWSALQLAVDQNSRELVTLMLAEGRRPVVNCGQSELAALEEAGGVDGMTRHDVVKMLIAHGVLAVDPNASGAIASGDAINGIDDKNSNCDGYDLRWWTDALVGKWVGSYEYRGTLRTEPTAFKIEVISSESASLLKKEIILFSGSGFDTIGEFILHGQAMSGKTFRLVKLYSKFGWMYEGKIDETDVGSWCIRGRWAKRFGQPPHGHFMVTKEMPA